jgi:hypothetical protein
MRNGLLAHAHSFRKRKLFYTAQFTQSGNVSSDVFGLCCFHVFRQLRVSVWFNLLQKYKICVWVLPPPPKVINAYSTNVKAAQSG